MLGQGTHRAGVGGWGSEEGDPGLAWCGGQREELKWEAHFCLVP